MNRTLPTSLTGVSPSIPELFRSLQLFSKIPYYHTKTPHLPKDSVWAFSFSIASTWEISLISFPRGTKMLQFPRFDFHHQCDGIHKCVRFSFGHLGIIRCVRLPRAYRSLPRPSSLLKPSNPPIGVFTPANSATYYTTMHDDHCKSSRDGGNLLHPSYITFMMYCIDDFCED